MRVRYRVDAEILRQDGEKTKSSVGQKWHSLKQSLRGGEKKARGGLNVRWGSVRKADI